MFGLVLDLGLTGLGLVLHQHHRILDERSVRIRHPVDPCKSVAHNSVRDNEKQDVSYGSSR